MATPFGDGERGFWWDADAEVHSRLSETVTRLRTQNAPRRSEILRLMRMYGNYSVVSQVDAGLKPDRLRYNLIADIVDTVVAEITAQKPRAQYLTTGGDWTLKQQAKLREQVLEAQLREAGLYSGMGQELVRDAAVTGTAFVHLAPDWQTLQPRVERVLPLEILVDESDARYGRPRAIYRQYVVDRQVLAARFPGHADALQDGAQTLAFTPMGDAEEWMIGTDGSEADLVQVIEAWRLPSHKGAKDGRHVIATESVTLTDEEYDSKRSRIVRLVWDPPQVGYFGIGVAEQLKPDQLELNHLLMKGQDLMRSAAGTWLVQKGSGVKSQHVRNVPGDVLYYTGVAPRFETPTTIPPDLWAQQDRIIQRARTRIGTNEMQAAGQKPAGIESGVAIRAINDMASQRQNPHAQRYEALYVELSEVLSEVNDEIQTAVKDGDADDKGALEVAVKARRGRRSIMKRVKWDETDLPDGKYVLQAYPTSALPSHPGGRLATIQEWIGAGLVDQTTAKVLLDFPDIEGTQKLELADYDYALWAYEVMVEDGQRVHVDPHVRLDLVQQLIRSAYVRGMVDEVPDQRLQLVRDFMQEIQDQVEKIQAAAQQAQAPRGPQGAPPAADQAGAAPPVDPALLAAGAA